MKTLLLAAGSSSLFAEAGFAWPANLVEVGGTARIGHVIEQLGPLAADGRLVAVVRRAEAMTHHTDRVIHLTEPSAQVVLVGDTAGAACSSLLALDHIDPDGSLLVCNGDQVLDVDLCEIVSGFERRQVDAGVVVFDAVHPRWSYVRTEGGFVVEASEKRPISRQATAGIYWFRRGADYIASVMDMVAKDASVNGMFFVCPSLNEMVLRGAVICVEEIDRQQYFSLHDPAGVTHYVQHLARPRAAAR